MMALLADLLIPGNFFFMAQTARFIHCWVHVLRLHSGTLSLKLGECVILFYQVSAAPLQLIEEMAS